LNTSPNAPFPSSFCTLNCFSRSLAAMVERPSGDATHTGPKRMRVLDL
jgi:hypothetical protein